MEQEKNGSKPLLARIMSHQYMSGKDMHKISFTEFWGKWAGLAMIFIFSIVLGAEYLFYVKSIATYNSVLAIMRGVSISGIWSAKW